jgi:hypothetical protein
LLVTFASNKAMKGSLNSSAFRKYDFNPLELQQPVVEISFSRSNSLNKLLMRQPARDITEAFFMYYKR